MEEKFFLQKSRILWLVNGDLNTAFFHNTVKSRVMHNAIRTITSTSGILLTSHEDISKEAVAHFQSVLTATATSAPLPPLNLDKLICYRCPTAMANSLVALVTEEEVKRVIYSMPSNKAPGPDGYTIEFFRSSWGIVGSELVSAIQSFFKYGFLPLGINATILTLIPKKASPETVKDFRPISCCNTIYKIISRILAARLRILMPMAIEPNQCAFIKGRLLLENVLLASELTKNYHKSNIAPRSALKVDISKAFDSVSWDFILEILRVMAIPWQFIEWIRICITSASFSLSINGNLEGYFQSKRGLRQGCSLSPLLFNIVMNVLSLLLNKAAEKLHIGYHPNCSKIRLTHLSFADDMMIFYDGSSRSLISIMDILHIFSSTSGLSINPNKSSLFIAGRIQMSLIDVVNELRIPIEELPIKYLGLPLTTKCMRKRDYDPLINRISMKLTAWTHKFLSYGGRLQLIKAVIASITNFWQAVFRLPKGCLQIIENMCSSFLWTGSILKHTGIKVRWTDISRPNCEGGLGLRSFRETNVVFSLNLIWRLFSSTTSLWVSWVQIYILREASFWELSGSSTKGSWIWRNLLKLRGLAKMFIRVELQSGEQANFWHDRWLGGESLWDSNHPNLPRELGVSRFANVKDVLSATGWSIRRPRNRVLLHTYEQIKRLPPPCLQAGHDIYLWRFDADIYKPSFNSHNTWKLIHTPSPKVSWSNLVWFSSAIPRQSFVVWMVFRECLPTGDKMRLWGRYQHCTFCGERNETKEHLFFGCPYTFQIWLPLVHNFTRNSISPDWNNALAIISSRRLNRVDSSILKLCFQSVIYAVWRERNSRIHNGVPKPFVQILMLVTKLISNKINALPSDSEHNKKIKEKWSASFNV